MLGLPGYAWIGNSVPDAAALSQYTDRPALGSVPELPVEDVRTRTQNAEGDAI